MHLLSIVLCTRNRAGQLRAALDSYRRLEAEAGWELVVVDNASEDATARVIQEFAATSALTLRAVSEPRPGLARARNRGLAEARGEIVAFTDDDCYPDPDYVRVLRNVFEDPRYDYAGGRVMLHDASDARISIQEHGTAKEIEPNAFLASGQILGANMAFRRAPLLVLRGFDERLGAGTSFHSGEDTDLLRRAALAGMRGRFDPMLVVRHHHGRSQADAAALRRSHQRGLGACMAKFVTNKHTCKQYIRHWYWALRSTGALNALRQLGWGLLFAFKYGPSPQRVWRHPAATIDASRESAVAKSVNSCI